MSTGQTVNEKTQAHLLAGLRKAGFAQRSSAFRGTPVGRTSVPTVRFWPIAAMRSCPLLMLPTIGGHLERSILLRMEVWHGTQASQALHA